MRTKATHCYLSLPSKLCSTSDTHAEERGSAGEASVGLRSRTQLHCSCSRVARCRCDVVHYVNCSLPCVANFSRAPHSLASPAQPCTVLHGLCMWCNLPSASLRPLPLAIDNICVARPPRFCFACAIVPARRDRSPLFDLWRKQADEDIFETRTQHFTGRGHIRQNVVHAR